MVIILQNIFFDLALCQPTHVRRVQFNLLCKRAQIQFISNGIPLKSCLHLDKIRYKYVSGCLRDRVLRISYSNDYFNVDLREMHPQMCTKSCNICAIANPPQNNVVFILPACAMFIEK